MRFPAFLPALLCLLLGTWVQAGDLKDSVYSKPQAAAGKKLYARHCIRCHDRSYFDQVLRTWQGESLGNLYLVMSSLMPEADPGSLADQEYLEITAYILSLSGFPAGRQPLTREALAQIKIP